MTNGKSSDKDSDLTSRRLNSLCFCMQHSVVTKSQQAGELAPKGTSWPLVGIELHCKKLEWWPAWLKATLSKEGCRSANVWSTIWTITLHWAAASLGHYHRFGVHWLSPYRFQILGLALVKRTLVSRNFSVFSNHSLQSDGANSLCRFSLLYSQSHTSTMHQPCR